MDYLFEKMKPRTASRVAWGLWLVTTLIVLATVWLLVLNHFAEPPGGFGFPGFSSIFALAFTSIGALIVSRHSRNRIGWVFLLAGLASGLQQLGNEYAVYAYVVSRRPLPLQSVAAWLPGWIWIPITGSITVYLFALFPTGSVMSKPWRLVPIIGTVGIVLASVGISLLPGPAENFRTVQNPFGLEGAKTALIAASQIGMTLYATGIVGGVVALIVRFRRSRGVERHQMQWLAFASIGVGAALISSFALTSGNPADAAPIPKYIQIIIVLSFLLIPISTGIAILRNKLFDIELIISRTVLYGVLAALVTAVYVGVVAGIGSLIGSRSNLALSLAATALVAITFQPARERIRGTVNRWVFGARFSPYEVITGFSRRVSGALSFQDLLPSMAEAAARGVGGSSARITLLIPGEENKTATWPAVDEPLSFEHSVDVVYQDERVGIIEVNSALGDSLDESDIDLLKDLASQAGLALKNLRLTSELEAKVEELRDSRQRIVTAQDGERRRMERDIHDGAQQQLVALAVKLGLARGLVERDPSKLPVFLDELKGEATEALETLRDLARGLYPPLLVDDGVVSALESHIRKMGLGTQLIADDAVRKQRPDLQAESAIYFCCREALQNVTKHADGASSIVELHIDGNWLAFSVRDEGPGFDPLSTKPGSGLQNMIDRLEALGGSLVIDSTPGGGTRVAGRLPLSIRVSA